jgi:UDP-GlcNAc:undecaprenyl-phosphate GlcNAc-1-phosphate transferase
MILSEIILLIIIILVNFIILIKFNFFKKFFPVYDVPDLIRKIHKFPVPVIGGFLILFNFLLTLIYLSVFNQNLLIKYSFSNFRDVIFLSIFLIFFFLVGIYDDKYNIKYKEKLIIIFFFSFLFFYTNEKLIIYSIRFIVIEDQYSLFLGKYSLLFSIFSLILLLISLNLLDGINLNLGSFYLINILFLFFLSKNIIFLYLIVPIIFFLILNYNSRIFLGDSGAFVITVILIYFLLNYYNQGLVTFDKIFLLFIYPIVDTVRVVIARFMQNKSLASGDRNHLHHILENKYGNIKTILILTLKNTILIILSIFINSLFLVITYLIVYLIIFLIIRKANVSIT